MYFDKRLVERGAIAPRDLREYEGEGLIDTGALTLVISPNIAEQLGLEIQHQQGVRYANRYEETVGVAEPVTIACQGRSTTLEPLIVGDEILIGQVGLE